MKYVLRGIVDKMHKVFSHIAVALFSFGLILFGVGAIASAVSSNSAPTYTVEQKKVQVKVFKLYGLNCPRCYRAIERKVIRLPGVVSVRVFDRTKKLVIRGSGYSMEEVNRIVKSEKQRIVR